MNVTIIPDTGFNYRKEADPIRALASRYMLIVDGNTLRLYEPGNDKPVTEFDLGANGLTLTRA